MDEQTAREQRHPDGGRPPVRDLDDKTHAIGGPTHQEGPSAEERGRAAMERANRPGGHADESYPAADDKAMHTKFGQLHQDELGHLPILKPGTALEQGSVYFDLNTPERGPFKAIGGQEAGRGDRYVAKRDIDYELWNRLVEQDRGGATAPRIERPAASAESFDEFEG